MQIINKNQNFETVCILFCRCDTRSFKARPDIPKYKESLGKKICNKFHKKQQKNQEELKHRFSYCTWIKGDHFGYEVEQFQYNICVQIEMKIIVKFLIDHVI